MTGGVYSMFGVDKVSVVCERQDCVSSIGCWVSTSFKACNIFSRARYLSAKKK